MPIHETILLKRKGVIPTKLKKIFKNKRGDAYIQFLVTLLALTTILSAALNGFSLFIQKQSIDNMAMELTRCLQINGEVNNSFDELYNKMTEHLTDKPIATIETTYIPGTKKIQLSEPIKVTLTKDATFLGIPIPIIGRGVGVCEVYHKT